MNISSASANTPSITSPTVRATAVANWRPSEPAARRRATSRCAATSAGAPLASMNSAISAPSSAL